MAWAWFDFGGPPVAMTSFRSFRLPLGEFLEPVRFSVSRLLGLESALHYESLTISFSSYLDAGSRPGVFAAAPLFATSLTLMRPSRDTDLDWAPVPVLLDPAT